MNDFKIKLRSFLARHIGKRRIADDTDIFASGYVTSLFAMQLVMFLEKECGIQLSREDLKLANFQTIDAICAMVAGKDSTETELLQRAV
jgi:acyl carrier protein